MHLFTLRQSSSSIPRVVKIFLFTLTCALFSVPATQGSTVDTPVRILVDTRELTLMVLRGPEEVLRFDNISIGRFGTAARKIRGDNKTPLGRYRIGWITDDTRYYRFFGLTYPNMEYADQAYIDGDLDYASWSRIRRAYLANAIPPQDTILGGSLGIHGIGTGDLEVHEDFNWTNGCVALTNEQIDQLTRWITVGTRIDIY